jgi:hypothetical protein
LALRLCECVRLGFLGTFRALALTVFNLPLIRLVEQRYAPCRRTSETRA